MNNFNLEEFGNRIIKLREKSGKSQEEICTELGVTQQTLSRYEKGQRQASLDFVYKASKYFNVSVDYLLGLTDIKSTNSRIKEICEFTGLTEESLNVILAIKTCPEYLTDNQRKLYTNQTPIETFNAIIEAINYVPNTLFHLNRLVNFKYSFKGEKAFKEKDITIFEAFKCAFPEADKFLENKAVFITNESYANILENQIKKEFKRIVSCVKDTYNPTPFNLEHNTNFNDMKKEKRFGDTLLSRIEESKNDYKLMKEIPQNDEEKEFKEYMETPEYKEREKKGELDWFEYPDEISKIKYKELINKLIKLSTEEEENAQHNPSEE